MAQAQVTYVTRHRVQGEDPNASGGEEEGRQRQWVTSNKKRALFKADNPKSKILNPNVKLKRTNRDNQKSGTPGIHAGNTTNRNRRSDKGQRN